MLLTFFYWPVPVQKASASRLILCCVIDAGQKLLDSLAETWDFFFCDVLSMLQAIFHPVQVHDHLKEPGGFDICCLNDQ